MRQPSDNQYHSIWTPELVEMNMTLAGLGRRMIAALIDRLILGLLELGICVPFIFLLFTSAAFKSPAVESILAILWFLLVILIAGLYDCGFHYWNNGQTIGKQLLKIRVVTNRGGRIGSVTCFLRLLVGILDWSLFSGCISALMILLTKQEKRIADYAAGTIVILEK